MKKVIIINNIISPLRIFLYNNLYKYYKEKGYKLKVIFLSETDENRNWKIKDNEIEFEFEILHNFAIRTKEKDLNTFFINFNIFKALNKEKPNKIICFGWDHFAAYASNWWCKKNEKEFILWSGSTKYEKSWRRTLFNPLVRYLIKRTDNFIAYGARAKEYLESLGAEKSKIQKFYNTIDVEYFEKKIKKFSERDKNKLRKKIGIKTSKTIIFSGRLIEMKGIYELLQGFNAYQKNIDSDISLLIMGTGPNKKNMMEIIKSKKIENVFFLGFIQYNNLYKYYAISNLLLFPSRQDIWGLVINEAIACNLPVITTKKVGASADLIEENKNGYSIKSNCSECICKAIEKIFDNNLHKKNTSFEVSKKISIDRIIKKITI